MERRLGQVDPGAAMVILDERDLLTFIEREPFSAIGRYCAIVCHIHAWMPSNGPTLLRASQIRARAKLAQRQRSPICSSLR